MNFTGSPSEQAFKQLIVSLLSVNELKPGISPYQLTFSTGTVSGYSFGYPQFDLAQGDSQVNSLFANILANATNANGSYVISPTLTGTARTAALAPGGTIAQLITAAEHKGGGTLSKTQVNQISAALDSTYGTAAIDIFTDTYLHNLIQQLGTYAGQFASGDTSFAGSQVFELLEIDTLNWFGRNTTYISNLVSSSDSGALANVGGLSLGTALLEYIDYRKPNNHGQVFGPGAALRRIANIVNIATGGAGYSPRNVQDAEGIVQAFSYLYLPNEASFASSRQAPNLASFITNVLQNADTTVLGSLQTAYGQTLVPSSFGRNIYIGLDNNAAVGRAGTALLAKTDNNNDILIAGAGPYTVIAGNGNDILIAQNGNDVLQAGSGADTLIAGAGPGMELTGTPGNDTLKGGSGSDTFVFAVPASGTAIETIVAPSGHGQVELSVAGQTITLGGTEDDPLGAVAGSPKTWQDSNGLQYKYNAQKGDLVISGGALGGNQIVVENFNIAAATSPNPSGGSPTGYLGFYFQNTVSVTAGANAGYDPPAPNFEAGSSQAYTVYLDAPSDTPQTITMSLSGVPASDFSFDDGPGVSSISSDGTFTVTIPAGDTSTAFTLYNTGDVGANATMHLTAAIPVLGDSGAPGLQSSPVTQSFAEPTNDPFSQSQTSTLYDDGTASLPGGGSYESYGNSPSDSSVSSVGSGPALIFVSDQANDSIVGGSGRDTIAGAFGSGLSDGGVNLIEGNGGQDIILASNNLVGLGGNSTPTTVNIFGGAETDLATAIGHANSGSASGLQGDFIASSDSGMVVGSNGNDLLMTTSSADDVIVAGPGNDTIVSGAAVISSSSLAGVTWSASMTGDQLDVDGTGLEFGSYASPSVPAGYEGNLDDSGNLLGDGSDTIFGGSGSDVIILSNGDNEVTLGSGSSTVLGGMGENTITGGSGNDVIRSGGGSDYIAASSGSDLIVGNGGDNTIIGGAGQDTLVAGAAGANYATQERGDNYVEAGTGNTLILGSGGNDTLIGGSGNDTIEAGAGSESVTGGSGTESIVGGAGSDTLAAGGDGNDTIWAGSGSTTISGGDGTDYLHGGSGADVIYAGDGGTNAAATDVIAGSGSTTIYGGDGINDIWGGSGANVIYAGDGGTDTTATQVVAGSGATTIYGGDGIDDIFGGSGTDVLYAGDGGTDTSPTYITAGTGTATLYGGAGSSVLTDSIGGGDLLIAGSGDADLSGMGNDTLEAGTGNCYLSGTGDNTYLLDSNSGNVEIVDAGGTEILQFAADVNSGSLTVSAGLDAAGQASLIIDEGSASITVDGGLSDANIAAINFGSVSETLTQFIQQEGGEGNTVPDVIAGTNGNLILDTTPQDSIIGGTGQDTISAWGNGDTIAAGDGGDLINAEGTGDDIFGGAGNDTIRAIGINSTVNAGTGNELFELSDPSDVVQAAAGDGSDTIEAGDSYTLPNYVDTLILTGSANLAGTGNGDASNTLVANSGSDTLTAGSGADTLISGSGIDTLVGGTGADTFVVNNSGDIITLPDGGAGDIIEASVDYVLQAAVGNLSLTGSGNLTATDEVGNAVITGNAGHDTLIAGSGADTLFAGSGVDTFEAGTGNNTFVVNNAADVIEATSAAGEDTVDASSNYTLSQHLDNLILTGDGNLVGQGNADASNTITGNSGNDTLIAGSGVDTLIAGDGIDTLVAGSGADLLEGNSGDTYELNAGFGNAEIQTAGGDGTVQFGTGILASDLTLSIDEASGSSSLVISDGSAAATVDGGVTGSVAQFNFADGSSLNLAQLLAAANVTSGSFSTGSGDVVVNTSAAATLSGGSGNDTLVGTGANDTLTAGSGNQLLIGSGNGDVLTAGTGSDTLEGAGADAYVIVEGSTATIDSSSTAEAEFLYLPTGMTFSDFASIEDAQGNLILQSASGDTTITIDGYYNNPSKSWVVVDGSGNSELLSSMVTSSSSPSTYAQEIGLLRTAFASNLTAELTQVGEEGGTIEDPTAQGAPYIYTHFTGVTTDAITPEDGAVNLGSSESATTTTYSADTSVTETYSVPVSTTTTYAGSTVYVPFNSGSSDDLMGTSTGGTPLFGTTETPVYNSSGEEIGVDLTTPSHTATTTTYETRTETFTAPETIDDVTRGFVNYKVTGDNGNDSFSATGPFVGTLATGNGNDYVNLGAGVDNPTANEVSITSPNFAGTEEGSPTPLGAFIEAGNGNDTITGTGGADVIAAGTGFDYLSGNLGTKYYVPLSGDSTDVIEDPVAAYGSGTFPMTTLVIPEGITADDLSYRVFQQSVTVNGQSIEQDVLQIRYGDSTVLVDYAPSPDPDDTNGPAPGVNQIQFANGTTVPISQLIAQASSGDDFNPVVSAQNQNIEGGQSVSAASFFSATDNADNPITWYQVTNQGTGGGYFEINGVAQAAGQTFYVSQDQLSDLQYVSGSEGTTDSVQVSAFDGAVWSSAATFDINAGEQTQFSATGTDQTIVGNTVGPDTLVGGYDGDQLIGQSGDDTFEYSVGGGSEYVLPTATAGSVNTLQFGAGLTAADVTLDASFWQGGALVLSLNDGQGSDSVTIGGFDPESYEPSSMAPVQFAFSDGTTLTLAQLLNDSAVTGGTGTFDTGDGTTWSYSFTPGQSQVYSVEDINASGQEVSSYSLNADGSYLTGSWNYNSDGSYSSEVVATTANGAQTTTQDDYDSQGQLIAENITNPDGSSVGSSWTYNSDGSWTFDTESVSADGTAGTQTYYQYDAQGQAQYEAVYNADGSSDYYTWNSQGQLTNEIFQNADGSNVTDNWNYNPDSSWSYTTYSTTAAGATTSTEYDYNPQSQLVSEEISNPDGSGTDYAWNTQGQLTYENVQNADGSSVANYWTYNSDSSWSDTTVSTTAAGDSTSTEDDYNSQSQLVSQEVTNPDGSTDNSTWNTQGQLASTSDTGADGSTTNSTYAYNSDGSYNVTAVYTPASGDPTTTVSDYSAQGQLLSQNAYTPSSADSSYTDTWSNADESHGTYWWNASTGEYLDTWYNADGSSFTDEYQYASGGSPTSGGSFTETYSDSAGDEGSRTYNASTGAITVTWDSASTGSISGTVTDSGFYGLQNDGELTNTQPDLSFFNPNASPTFQGFLTAHG